MGAAAATPYLLGASILSAESGRRSAQSAANKQRKGQEVQAMEIKKQTQLEKTRLLEAESEISSKKARMTKSRDTGRYGLTKRAPSPTPSPKTAALGG